MSYNNIIYATDDRLAFITLNRPEKLNPLSHALRGEVYDAMKQAEADKDIGVIILKAEGRSFSAGYDLAPTPEESDYVSERSGMPDTGSTHPQHYDWSRHALMGHWTIWELAKPVVCQIHGYCLAGGTELASMCDMRIVAEDARIGYPPVRAMGTMDMMWAPWFLPPVKAREFAYTGDWFTGTEMAQLGWANYAVPADELPAFTEMFARRMGHIDNDLLNYNKRAVNRQYEIMGIRTGLMSGTDVEALSKHRPAASEFGRHVREEGLKAALEWRDGPFGDFRGERESAPKNRPLAGSDNDKA
ncbi:MAG: enoyl-CoA hydratase-related protein [Pseudomonadales bacterium]|nr:enoyl-CoA hydratase-related protein [Pseudomonadales bacterium]MDP7594061.1 enoyl-CoA hydratase-related protein [Pseudomonadales bacterium]HJN53144.1 enoyl-CoA hydratase-related protein [Pseudomonadales bacterium]